MAAYGSETQQSERERKIIDFIQFMRFMDSGEINELLWHALEENASVFDLLNMAVDRKYKSHDEEKKAVEADNNLGEIVNKGIENRQKFRKYNPEYNVTSLITELNVHQTVYYRNIIGEKKGKKKYHETVLLIPFFLMMTAQKAIDFLMLAEQDSDSSGLCQAVINELIEINWEGYKLEKPAPGDDPELHKLWEKVDKSLIEKNQPALFRSLKIRTIVKDDYYEKYKEKKLKEIKNVQSLLELVRQAGFKGFNGYNYYLLTAQDQATHNSVMELIKLLELNWKDANALLELVGHTFDEESPRERDMKASLKNGTVDLAVLDKRLRESSAPSRPDHSEQGLQQNDSVEVVSTDTAGKEKKCKNAVPRPEKIEEILREECANNPYGTTINFIKGQLSKDGYTAVSSKKIERTLTASPWATQTAKVWKYKPLDEKETTSSESAGVPEHKTDDPS